MVRHTKIIIIILSIFLGFELNFAYISGISFHLIRSVIIGETSSLLSFNNCIVSLIQLYLFQRELVSENP